MEGLSVCCIILALLGSLFHGSGAICLFKTNRNFEENIELFSLSASTILLFILSIIYVIIGDHYPAFFKINHTSHEVPEHISMVHDSVFQALLFPILGSMISLTLQRYFAVRLHLSYESSWIFLNRTRIIVSIWLLGFVNFLVLLTIELAKKIDSRSWNIAKTIMYTISLAAVNSIFFKVYVYI